MHDKDYVTLSSGCDAYSCEKRVEGCGIFLYGFWCGMLGLVQRIKVPEKWIWYGMGFLGSAWVGKMGNVVTSFTVYGGKFQQLEQNCFFVGKKNENHGNFDLLL